MKILIQNIQIYYQYLFLYSVEDSTLPSNPAKTYSMRLYIYTPSYILLPYQLFITYLFSSPSASSFYFNLFLFHLCFFCIYRRKCPSSLSKPSLVSFVIIISFFLPFFLFFFILCVIQRPMIMLHSCRVTI